MTTTTLGIQYGTRGAFGSASNLNSLANNQALPLGEVANNGTPPNTFLDYQIDLSIKLAASGLSASGTILIYYIESPVAQSGSPNYTDGINPNASSNVSAALNEARLLKTLNANSTLPGASGFCTFGGRLSDYGINKPSQFWSLVVDNLSGAALASSGHTADITPINEQNG